MKRYVIYYYRADGSYHTSGVVRSDEPSGAVFQQIITAINAGQPPGLPPTAHGEPLQAYAVVDMGDTTRMIIPNGMGPGGGK